MATQVPAVMPTPIYQVERTPDGYIVMQRMQGTPDVPVSKIFAYSTSAYAAMGKLFQRAQAHTSQ